MRERTSLEARRGHSDRPHWLLRPLFRFQGAPRRGWVQCTRARRSVGSTPERDPPGQGPGASPAGRPDERAPPVRRSANLSGRSERVKPLGARLASPGAPSQGGSAAADQPTRVRGGPPDPLSGTTTRAWRFLPRCSSRYRPCSSCAGPTVLVGPRRSPFSRISPPSRARRASLFEVASGGPGHQRVGRQPAGQLGGVDRHLAELAGQHLEAARRASAGSPPNSRSEAAAAARPRPRRARGRSARGPGAAGATAPLGRLRGAASEPRSPRPPAAGSAGAGTARRPRSSTLIQYW